MKDTKYLSCADSNANTTNIYYSVVRDTWIVNMVLYSVVKDI